MEIIEVIWRDAVSDEGSFNEGDKEKIASLEMTSVGIFWFEDDEKLVIARDFFPDGNYRGILTIPKELIKGRHIINP